MGGLDTRVRPMGRLDTNLASVWQKSVEDTCLASLCVYNSFMNRLDTEMLPAVDEQGAFASGHVHHHRVLQLLEVFQLF